jgi:hypothetical protein
MWNYAKLVMHWNKAKEFMKEIAKVVGEIWIYLERNFKAFIS